MYIRTERAGPRCSRANRPMFTHSVNRRCAAVLDTPNEAGIADHAQPVYSTYRIAASTARSSVRRRPPPWRRCGCGGINNEATIHNGSGHHFSTSLRPTRQPHPPAMTPKRDAVLIARPVACAGGGRRPWRPAMQPPSDGSAIMRYGSVTARRAHITGGRAAMRRKVSSADGW